MQNFQKRIDDLFDIRAGLMNAIEFQCSSETQNFIVQQIKKLDEHIDYLLGLLK